MFNKIIFSILTIIFINACSSTIFNRSADSKQSPPLSAANGVQLWADNCARCHNIRPPESYSDVQWNVAVLHMRVRANLTADDANAIVKYLKSAN